MPSPVLPPRIATRWVLPFWALVGITRAVAAAETNPPAAAGTYREKVDLVTDASVADSLSRQKNLSFSSVRIDGETSEMSLSALTADQIENAEATKVPTPDLDADAVGGLLQLTSRPSFLQKGRTLRGSLELSYDPRPQPGNAATVGLHGHV